MATICAESNAKRRKLRCPGARVGFSTKAYRDGMGKWEDLHEVKLFRSVCLCVLYSLFACMLYIYVYIRMKYMCIYIYMYMHILDICINMYMIHILIQSWWMILYFNEVLGENATMDGYLCHMELSPEPGQWPRLWHRPRAHGATVKSVLGSWGKALSHEKYQK
jgi:hypothetical protein